MVRGTPKICAFLAPLLVSAIPWPGAQETPIIPGNAQVGWNPAPTSPPLAYGGMEIFGRQASRPANVCGYVHTDPSNTFTCGTAYVCATNADNGVHGCCDPNALADCFIKTTCVPRTAMSECTGACLSNGYIARCTASSMTECYNIDYNFGATTMTEWGCTDAETTVRVDYTTSGQSLISSALPSIPISTRVVTVTAPNDSSAAAETAPTAGSNANDNDPDSNSNNIHTSSGRKKTPVGAIAGGVIGGIAVLAVIIGTIIFFCIRRKRSTADNTPSPSAPAGPTAPGYQHPPMQGPQGPQYPNGQYPPAPYGGYPQGPYDPANMHGAYDAKPPVQDYKYNYTPTTEGVANGPAELGGQGQAVAPVQLDSTPVAGQTVASTTTGQRPVAEAGGVHELGS